MSYPYGVAIDSSNNVYAANWADTPHTNTTVSKITPGGAVSDYLTGLTAPEGLAFDGSNNLYVSNYYAGTISKRTPQGVVSEFASGLSGPLGLAFDPVTGSLFVANTDGGTISAITSLGVVSQFASGLDRPLFIAVGTSAIPEPSTSALLVGLGTLGFVGWRRRHRKIGADFRSRAGARGEMILIRLAG
jgi:DNA-binding beta-propeller fold protein YncE